jgi:hypothetical protein
MEFGIIDDLLIKYLKWKNGKAVVNTSAIYRLQ